MGELAGPSANQAAAELNRRKIATAAGGQWFATQVIRCASGFPGRRPPEGAAPGNAYQRLALGRLRPVPFLACATAFRAWRLLFDGHSRFRRGARLHLKRAETAPFTGGGFHLGPPFVFFPAPLAPTWPPEL